MDEASGELKEGFFGVAVGLILFSGVKDGLICPGIFEFEGCNGQAIDEDDHIYRKCGILFGVVYLSGDREDVVLEVLGDFGIDGVVGQAIQQCEMCVVNVQSAFEDFDNAVALDFAVQAFQDQTLPVGARTQFVQFVWLREFEESPEFFAVNGKFAVEVCWIARFVRDVVAVSSCCLRRTFDVFFAMDAANKGLFYARFKGLFVGFADHGESSVDFLGAIGVFISRLVGEEIQKTLWSLVRVFIRTRNSQGTMVSDAYFLPNTSFPQGWSNKVPVLHSKGTVLANPRE